MICCKEAVYIDRFLCSRAKGVKDDLAMERPGEDASDADTDEEKGDGKDGSDAHVVVVEN